MMDDDAVARHVGVSPDALPACQMGVGAWVLPGCTPTNTCPFEDDRSIVD